MKDVTIKEFCDKFNACSDGVEWAEKNCPSGMMSEAWDLLSQASDQETRGYFLWVGTRCYDDRTLRLLAVRFVRETPLADGRKVFDLLTDERSVNAIVVAERFALGLASEEELDAAWVAARAAARAAAGVAAWAAWAAAGDAAWAAWDAAQAAAGVAAWAAWAAARDAAWAAWAAARDAAWAAQLQMIRDLGNPFKEPSNV